MTASARRSSPILGPKWGCLLLRALLINCDLRHRFEEKRTIPHPQSWDNPLSSRTKPRLAPGLTEGCTAELDPIMQPGTADLARTP